MASASVRSGVSVVPDQRLLQRDLRPGVRVVVEPAVDGEAVGADGDHLEGIGAGGDIDQAGQCADAGALVAAAGLVPAVDEDDPELRIIAVEQFAHQAQVARLEDAQRQGCVGKSTDPRGNIGMTVMRPVNTDGRTVGACLAFPHRSAPTFPAPDRSRSGTIRARRASSRCPCV
jgi:hypothetical protein